MEGYLGETVVKIKDTEFKDYTPTDWALYYIERYGQIDGSHHKQWVMDQVVRILKGTEVIVSEAKWDDGQKEYRVELGTPTKKYKEWAIYMLGDIVDGEYEYSYDEGIAP